MTSQNTIFSIIFSLDPSQELIERRLFGVLDLLAEIGGLQGLLASTFAFIVSILYPNLVDKYLVNELFVLHKASGGDRKYPN